MTVNNISLSFINIFHILDRDTYHCLTTDISSSITILQTSITLSASSYRMIEPFKSHLLIPFVKQAEQLNAVKVTECVTSVNDRGKTLANALIRKPVLSNMSIKVWYFCWLSLDDSQTFTSSGVLPTCVRTHTHAHIVFVGVTVYYTIKQCVCSCMYCRSIQFFQLSNISCVRSSGQTCIYVHVGVSTLGFKG